MGIKKNKALLWILIIVLSFQGIIFSIEKVNYKIIGTIPHLNENFTQGLLFHQDFLYESTGQWGDSVLKKIDLKTGKILKKARLTDQYFGEGLALHNNRLIQLTWVSKKAFIYSLQDFKIQGFYSYPGEGWGLTSTPEGYIMSNGSENLQFLDFEKFNIKKIIPIKFQGRPLKYLNELEYVKGYIYANVLFSDKIFVIKPQTGKIVKYLDFAELVKKNATSDPDTVLNGIAYNAKKDLFYITGKNWRLIYIIKLSNKE